METINGNLLDCTENIIVHQTNCQGVMGSGLAKQIKAKYKEVFNGYYHYCKTNEPTKILGSALICEANDGKYIANVFGQLGYGEGLQTDYAALENALKEVYEFAKEKNLSVAFPYKLSCGLAGGDWTKVEEMLNTIFTDVEAKIYKLGE